MAERRQRTPEEREAARLERERQRAARSGKPPRQRGPKPVAREPAPPPVARDPAPEPVAREPDPEPVARETAPPPIARDPAPEPVAREPDPEPVTREPVDREPVAREPDPGPMPRQPDPEPAAREPDPEPWQREPVSVSAPAGMPSPAERVAAQPSAQADPLATGTAETDLETEEDELELPSGTRRVTARDARPVPPPLRPRKQRKPPKQRLPRKPAGEAGTASGKPGERRRGRLWLVRVASLLALAVAAAVIWFVIQVFQPFGTSPHGRITVTIPAHSSSSQIGDQLAREGVISSSFFFGVRATLDGDRSDLRSGVYHFQLGMSYGAVLKALTTVPPAAKVSEITITEGRRRKQVDQLLRAQHVQGSYLAATRTTKLLNLRAYGLRHKPPSLEGFLFPDTYQLVQPVRVQRLVDAQVQTFKKEFAKVDLSYARRHHLTPYDVLIIASLIEGETPTVHDRPLVSSVIYNRLADGMMLQLDATTQYATGNFTRPLTVSQLHSHSPYNTRTHLGLPPTPIGNPGMASIQAAAHPAHTKYLFFFAKPCQRGSVFATNYSQFLNLGAKYQHRHC